MSWKEVIKYTPPSMKEEIKDMEEYLEREMKRSLSELSIYEKKEIEMLRRQARGLIQSLKEHDEGKRRYGGEIENFYEEVMDMIEYIRAGGLWIDAGEISMTWKEIIKAKVGGYPPILEGNKVSEKIREEYQNTAAIKHKYRDSQVEKIFEYGENNSKHFKAIKEAKKLIKELNALDYTDIEKATRLDEELTKLLGDLRKEYYEQLPSIFDL